MGGLWFEVAVRCFGLRLLLVGCGLGLLLCTGSTLANRASKGALPCCIATDN